MKELRNFFRFLCVLVFIVFQSMLQAQTSYTWNGGGDGTSWNDATKWTPAGIPGANTGDKVLLNIQDTLQMSVDRTINEVVITAGVIDLGGRLLRVNTASTFNGGLLNQWSA